MYIYLQGKVGILPGPSTNHSHPPRTHLHLDALGGENFHRRAFLGRVAIELPPALVPFDRVQAFAVHVVVAVQGGRIAPPHRGRHRNLNVAQGGYHWAGGEEKNLGRKRYRTQETIISST